jgi:hypothetical protein
LDSLWNVIGPDTQLQIKGHKKSTYPPSCVKFCTLTYYYYYYLLSTVASCYNCCTDGTSPGNYGWQCYCGHIWQRHVIEISDNKWYIWDHNVCIQN